MKIFTARQRRYALGGKAEGLFFLQEAELPGAPFMVLHFPHWSGTDLAASEQKQVLEALAAWPWRQKGLAVRSSAPYEDGAVHSFAGMFQSDLKISTEEALWSSIKAVAESQHSLAVARYCQERAIPQAASANVILQIMLEPEWSGVAFSTYPPYPEEMALHLVPGLAALLVQGEQEAHEFYYAKNSGLCLAEMAQEFDKICQMTPSGPSLKACPSPIRMNIPPEKRQELTTQISDLEQKAGYPLDIELCYQDQKWFFVQARPITAAIPSVEVYDNSNIQESYCGVTTPLSFSFAQKAYATVYQQIMRTLALPEKTIKAHQSTVDNLLVLYRGRVYYQLKNWYKGLLLLPAFRQNKADLERMMGVQEPVDFVEDQNKSWGQKLRLAPSLLINLLRLLWAFRRLPRSTRAFKAHFERHFEEFYRHQWPSLSAAQLWQLKMDLDRNLLQNWTLPIVNDFFVMMSHGRALRLLKRKGYAEPEKALKEMLLGDPDLASLKPTLALMALAHEWRQDPELCRALQALEPGQALAFLQQHHPSLASQVAAYCHLYGDRIVGELKLETISMREDAAIFFKYLNNYLEGPLSPLSSRPPDLRMSRYRQIKNLRAAIHRREDLRLERTRLFGMYRRLFIELGVRFKAQGLLGQARDIFYLTESEIGRLLNRDLAEVRDLISTRQSEFESYKREDPPARVVWPSRPRKPAPDDQSPRRFGEVVVAGMLEGEVVVIHSPEDDLDLRGKIVCALRTDPGWAALFPMAKAVIIEKGSALSHSVILLRELGIPSLINIPGLCRWLKSGDQLVINAEEGWIEKK